MRIGGGIGALMVGSPYQQPTAQADQQAKWVGVVDKHIRNDEKNFSVPFLSLFVRKGRKKVKCTYFYKLCHDLEKFDVQIW